MEKAEKVSKGFRKRTKQNFERPQMQNILSASNAENFKFCRLSIRLRQVEEQTKDYRKKIKGALCFDNMYFTLKKKIEDKI